MGSLGAMADGSRDRYFQGDVEAAKLVPRESRGACPIAAASQQRAPDGGGLRSGMGYVGAADLAELRQKARFVRISQASLQESHVHDVVITKEAPNYRLE